MADQIDPDRTNIELPNTVQRLTPFGSDEEFIGKILLTSHGLLMKGHLASHINSNSVMLHIAEMRVLSDRFGIEQDRAIENFQGKIGQNRALILPSMVNVEIRVREFFQKADHALQKLFDVVKFIRR